MTNILKLFRNYRW